MQPRVSIVIPNWNGRAFLARCLAGAVQSGQDSGFSCECIVVDDASSDGSADIVEQDFPRVRLIRQTVNLGFGPTMNHGADEATGEFLVCLNNDLVAKPQLIRELVQPLVEDAQLFGVTGKTIDWNDGAPNHVNMAARWNGSGMHITHENSTAPAPTMFLQGGCCAFRRAEFLQLGGFCELYAPGYWEDYDISYAALKAGWRNQYNPRALAYHFGGGSMGKAMGEDRLRAIKERNRHLFHLVNVTDPELLRSHTAGFPSWLARSREPRLKVRVAAATQVAQRLGQVEAVRQLRAKWQKRTDREIMAEFAEHGKS